MRHRTCPRSSERSRSPPLVRPETWPAVVIGGRRRRQVTKSLPAWLRRTFPRSSLSLGRKRKPLGACANPGSLVQGRGQRSAGLPLEALQRGVDSLCTRPASPGASEASASPLTCTVSALGGIRTPNLLIRSQMLYPLSYQRRGGCSVPGGWLVTHAGGMAPCRHSGDEACRASPADRPDPGRRSSAAACAAPGSGRSRRRTSRSRRGR
jgi:hypothetical protein